jgi:hypothetical protein
MNPNTDSDCVPPLPTRLPEGSLSPDFVTVFEQAVLRATRACLETNNGFRFALDTKPNVNGHWIGGSLDLGGHFPRKPWVGFKLHADRGEVELWRWIEVGLPHVIARKGEISDLLRKSNWTPGKDNCGLSYFQSCGRVEPGSDFAPSITALEAGIEFLIERLSPALAHI